VKRLGRSMTFEAEGIRTTQRAQISRSWLITSLVIERPLARICCWPSASPGGRKAKILLHQLRKELGRREQDGEGRQQHKETGAELARRHHPLSAAGLRRVASQVIINRNNNLHHLRHASHLPLESVRIAQN
jgi:hypothetical protein